MGWGREAVSKGLNEASTGIRCMDNYQGRGLKKTEEKIPGIKEDILSVVEPQTQADPAMKTSLTYNKDFTGKSPKKALIDEKGYKNKIFPRC